MKVAINFLNLVADFPGIDSLELKLESPADFSECVSMTNSQIIGEKGEILISDDDVVSSEIVLGKNADILLSPFSVDLNQKKLLNKLYSEMNDMVIDEQYQTAFMEIKSKLIGLIMELEKKYQFVINYNLDVEFTSLLKALSVCIGDCDESLIEKIDEYIKVSGDLGKIKLIVFVDFDRYFTSEEIEKLCVTLRYNEIKSIWITGCGSSLDACDERVIVDPDHCIIM